MSHLDEGQLHALLDGELEAEERAVVEAHLSSCAECARMLEQAVEFTGEAETLVQSVEVPVRTRPAPRVQPPPSTPRADRPARRVALYRRVGWAASLVLAAGLGYVANDLSRRKPPASEAAEPALSVSVARESSMSRNLPDTQSPRAEAAPTPTPPPASRLAERAGRAAAKPNPERTEPRPAPPSDTVTIHLDELAEAARSLPDTPEAQALRPRDQSVPTEKLRDSMAPARAGVEPLLPNQVAKVSGAAHGLAPGVIEQSVGGFRIITMDEAVRRLSGTIRLIDGMTPDRVQVGPGRLVAGSDPGREVVRVVYRDQPRRELWLDQQRTAPGPETRAEELDRSGSTLLFGDTVVAAAGDGATRVIWLDKAGFWLSLTGQVSQDSLRNLIRQIR